MDDNQLHHMGNIYSLNCLLIRCQDTNVSIKSNGPRKINSNLLFTVTEESV